jgi:hypothetical protein
LQSISQQASEENDWHPINLRIMESVELQQPKTDSRPRALFQSARSWAECHSRLLVWLGVLAATGLAVLNSAVYVPVTRGWVEGKLADPRDDIYNLYRAAAKAGVKDVPGWFVGPWLNKKVGYYRPITSLLYVAEYHAFGDDFSSYNRVSLLIHGMNTGLLFLVTVSLFRERKTMRVLYGLIASIYFATMSNSMWSGVYFSIGWWPAQNDLLSLTFGLLSLLLLDNWLVSNRRPWLIGSIVAFLFAIGTKEMAYATVPVAIALIWHRKRRATREMAFFAILGALLWTMRKLVIPNPWAENYFSNWVYRKASFYAGGPPLPLMLLGIWWPIVAAAGSLAIAPIGLRKGWPVITIVATIIVFVGLCAWFVPGGSTWMLIFEDGERLRYYNCLVYFLAPILFWRYRREEPGCFSLLAFAGVLVPILQFVGHHYLYWPGAFLALSDACFCACLVRCGMDLKETANWRITEPAAEESAQA